MHARVSFKIEKEIAACWTTNIINAPLLRRKQFTVLRKTHGCPANMWICTKQVWCAVRTSMTATFQSKADSIRDVADRVIGRIWKSVWTPQTKHKGHQFTYQQDPFSTEHAPSLHLKHRSCLDRSKRSYTNKDTKVWVHARNLCCRYAYFENVSSTSCSHLQRWLEWEPEPCQKESKVHQSLFTSDQVIHMVNSVHKTGLHDSVWMHISAYTPK